MSTFSQLLRRSAFAAHDPLITRVYASNPRSIAAHADWGLKFPVHRARGSRYIKLSSLDAGPGIGADWRSAEKEARFINTWGDGTVSWEPKRESLSRQLQNTPRASLLGNVADAYAEYEAGDDAETGIGSAASSRYMPNVEAMTDAEFERYLDHIRRHRAELADRIYDAEMPDTAREERTLPHAARLGLTRESDGADFQTSLTARDLSDPASKRLHSRPHHLHGLTYAPARPASAARTDPSLVHPGRALDKVSHRAAADSRARSITRDGTNHDWVVGLGGLTALGKASSKRVADSVSLVQFDYSRQKPNAGSSHFQVNQAEIVQPPRVLGLASRGDSGRRWLERGVSAARRPGPLESFRFQIHVEEDSSFGSSSRPEVGSPQWVARDRATASASTTAAEGDLGLGALGGKRSSRVQGQGALAAERLRQASGRAQSSDIANLLLRIGNQSSSHR